MVENEKKSFFKNKIIKAIFKIVLTVPVLYISFLIGLCLILICSAEQIIVPLNVCSALILPGLLLPLIAANERRIFS